MQGASEKCKGYSRNLTIKVFQLRISLLHLVLLIHVK